MFIVLILQPNDVPLVLPMKGLCKVILYSELVAPSAASIPFNYPVKTSQNPDLKNRILIENK